MASSRRTGAVITAALLALTACSGGDEPAESTSKASSSAPSPASPTTPDDLASPIDALGDDYPSIEAQQPLPDDVTSGQLRAWVASGRLPLAKTQSPHFETMINALDARREAPDVMVFGDSMTQQGIDPQVLGEELGQATGRDVTAFNAATSKARWGINRMIARHLVETDKAPDVAILVISTRAGDGDPHYEETVSRTPFSSVVEGCDRDAEGWTEEDASACESHIKDFRQRFSGAGDQVARAQQGRYPQTSLRVDDDTWLRSDGFMIHPSATKAAVEKKARSRAKGRSAGLPQASELGRTQFRDIARILEEQGTTVIATEIPYSPAYQQALERKTPSYDERRQRAARQLAEGADVEHFPVDSYGDWWGDGDSRDEIHLAPQGAKKYTRQLLDDTPGLRAAVTTGLRRG